MKNKKLIILVSAAVLLFLVYKLLNGGILFLKLEIEAIKNPVKDLSSVKLALERTVNKFPGKFTSDNRFEITKDDKYNGFNESIHLSLWGDNFITTKYADIYLTNTKHRFQKAFHFGGGHFTYEHTTIGGHLAYDNGSTHFLYRNLHVYLEFPSWQKENVDIFWTEFDKQLDEILKENNS